MATKIHGGVDLLLFELINALADNVTSDPGSLGSAEKGLVWFNTTTNKWKYWNGSAAIDPLDRGVHTGSQLANTISNFMSTVFTARLDQLAVPTADVSLDSHKLTNVTDGTANGDAVNKGQLDAAIAGLASGQVLKGPVRVATEANVSISSAPAAVDGVTLSNGDLVLLAGQTDESEEGPYQFNGTGSALTRASNWNSNGEATLGSYWVVREGTYAENFALLMNDSAITLDTTDLDFLFINATGAAYTAGAGLILTGSDFAVGAGLGITVNANDVAIDPTVVARKPGGVIPASTSGIFSVSGATVTVNHGLNNKSAKPHLVAHTSPAAGFTEGEALIVNYVNSDANNTVLTLPGNPASNNWHVTILG